MNHYAWKLMSNENVINEGRFWQYNLRLAKGEATRRSMIGYWNARWKHEGLKYIKRNPYPASSNNYLVLEYVDA